MISETELESSSNNNFDVGENANVTKIFNQTYKLAKMRFSDIDYKESHTEWLKLIRHTKTTVNDLISVVSLTSTRNKIDEEKTSRELKAMREAILAEVDRRNTNKISNNATRLDIVGLVLAAVTLIAIFV